MKKVDFDWDKYFSRASWEDIREKSPFLATLRLPTIVLEEKRLVYISSQDDYCSTDDAESMKALSKQAKSTYDAAVLNKNYSKAAIAKCDYKLLHSLLFALDHHIDEDIG